MPTISKGHNQGGACRCEGCGARFSGLTAFDMHRAGEYAKHSHSRRCLTVAEMRAKGMTLAARGVWTTGREYDRVRATA